MVSDGVTLVEYLSYDLRITLYVTAQGKKAGPSSVMSEYVQDLRRVNGMWSVIKCQSHRVEAGPSSPDGLPKERA
jgi:hypothetical protein